MQNPQTEIKKIAFQIATAPSPDAQKELICKYFTEDAGFRHPLCLVQPGPLSREDVLGIYQWYRVLSPKIDFDVKSVLYDQDNDIIIMDVTQLFHIRFSPFQPMPSHFIVRLTLRKVDRLSYIELQEEFYQPDDFLNLLVPPIVPLTRLFLAAAGIISTVYAKSAQVFGFWRTGSVMANKAGRMLSTNLQEAGQARTNGYFPSHGSKNFQNELNGHIKHE